ncbi:hypothetical protein ACFQZU_14500, partial [Streptomonospora algeriensis]
DVQECLAEGARLAGAALQVPGDVPPRSESADGPAWGDGPVQAQRPLNRTYATHATDARSGE